MIAELRGRERVVVPPPAASAAVFARRSGAPHGWPFMGFSGLVAGMRPHQRAALLLQSLGRDRSGRADAEPASGKTPFALGTDRHIRLVTNRLMLAGNGLSQEGRCAC